MESIQSQCKDTTDVSFRLLATWAGKDAKLMSILKHRLKRIRLMDIVLCDIDTTAAEERELHPLISAHLEIPFLVGPKSSKFLINISEKLQCCWRSIGRLMGIPDQVLETVAMGHLPPEPLHEQSYHMIYEWQRKNGDKATYGILFKAIKCLFDHPSNRLKILDAHKYATDYVKSHFPDNQSYVHVHVYTCT